MRFYIWLLRLNHNGAHTDDNGTNNDTDENETDWVNGLEKVEWVR